MVSAASSRIAPASSEIGISRRLSGPVSRRIIWGTSRPTKPMIPETDTQMAATIEAVIKSARVTFLVSTPNEDAVRSPRDIRFKSRAKNIKIKKPQPTNKNVRPTSAQVLDPKLPINQKMITATCSSAIYFKKLMPADNMAATMIPERIKLVEETPPPEADRYMTKNKVVTAPIKAKSGTEAVPMNPIFNKMAKEAPKAAPAETPRV